MSTKAVIFDLDDTLVSELSYAMSGYRAVAAYIVSGGRTDRDREQIFRELKELFDTDHKNVFNRFLLNNGLSDDRESVMELVDVYRNHFPDISYFDDVLPVVAGLKEKGIKTGILSDGYAVTQRQKIKALRAEDDFDIIVLTDEMGRDAWKPSPEGFRIIGGKFKIEAGEMLYVGDNPEKDFYLSETAGVKTARIIRENGVYNNRSYYNDVREDFRIESLYELMEYVV